MLFCKQFLHVFILLCKGGFTLTAFRARRVHTADSTVQTPGMSAQRLEKNKTILILMHGVARCAAPYTQRVGTMQRRTSGGQRRVTPYRLSSVRFFLQFFLSLSYGKRQWGTRVERAVLGWGEEGSPEGANIMLHTAAKRDGFD